MAPTTEQRRATEQGERAYQAAKASRPVLEQSVVFYRGPSQLTGEPILAIAGRKSVNPKTGPVVQTWILRSDLEPIAAVKSGADRAICGDCRLRGDGHGRERTCYVNVAWAPNNIYRAQHKAEALAPRVLGKQLAGVHVRLGAYGDPVAVPMAVWLDLITHASGWTAYSHQWRRPEAQAYRALCMASVDSEAEQLEAAGRGWRTFRVRLAADPVLAHEVVCPASEEAGHMSTCQACGLCRGLARPAKSVAIIAHGNGMKWFASRAAAAGASERTQ